jgi:hypothetical protein
VPVAPVEDVHHSIPVTPDIAAHWRYPGELGEQPHFWPVTTLASNLDALEKENGNKDGISLELPQFVSVSARVAPSTAFSLPPGVGMVLWYTTVQAKSKELRAAIIHAEEVEALRRTQQQQPSRTLQVICPAGNCSKDIVKECDQSVVRGIKCLLRLLQGDAQFTEEEEASVMELLQHTNSEKQTPGEKKARMQRSKFLNALASHCRSFAWPSGESILFSLQDVRPGPIRQAVLDSARQRGVPQDRLLAYFLACGTDSTITSHILECGLIGLRTGLRGFGTELLRECLRDPRERHLTPEAFAKAFGRQQLPPRQGGPADEKMCVLDHICENHTADAKTAQRALELLGAHVTEQEVFAELSSVLLALQTPLDVKLELETRPLQPVAVLARHLRRAWEPWAAKYEPFRNDPKHARDMAAQVAAELSASPFPLLRERALEADPSCIPRMRQTTARYMRKPGRYSPQPDFDVTLTTGLPPRGREGPVGLWRIQTSNGYVDLPPSWQVFSQPSKLRTTFLGQPVSMDTSVWKVEVPDEDPKKPTVLSTMARPDGEWWAKPDGSGGAWRRLDVDASAILSASMRGQSCRFADGNELYQADLMTGQVHNMRTHLVYEPKLPRQQSVWMWKSPETRKDEKDKPKEKDKKDKKKDKQEPVDGFVGVPINVAAALDVLAQRSTTVRWHERDDPHIYWEADVLECTARRIAGKAPGQMAPTSSPVQTYKIQPPF